VLSLPDHHSGRLNTLHVRSGRLPEPERTGEVVVNEAFATAHGFGIGSRFHAILNGKKYQLHIVGIALSPEFIYAIGPGDLMPDDRRFAVLWMSAGACMATAGASRRAARIDLNAPNAAATHKKPAQRQVDASVSFSHADGRHLGQGCRAAPLTADLLSPMRPLPAGAGSAKRHTRRSIGAGAQVEELRW
jgi:hypothetical protein